MAEDSDKLSGAEEYIAAEIELSEPLDPVQVQAAFRDTNVEYLQNIHRALADTRSSILEIDTFLTATVGSDRAPDMNGLITALKEIDHVVSPYVGSPHADEDSPGGAPGPRGGSAGAESLPGTIRSRQDVVRLLEDICAYYARTEPASPIPLLLRRAQRLVSMDFLQIITELTPDALSQIMMVAGQRTGAEQSGGLGGPQPS